MNCHLIDRSAKAGFILAILAIVSHTAVAAQFSFAANGKSAAVIYADLTGARGTGAATLNDAATWLSQCIERACGNPVIIVEKIGGAPTVVIARSDAYPEIAKAAGLNSNAYDAFCIVSQTNRLYLLGNSEAGARHAVATLLRHFGFRWFAPSPKWHHVPELKTISIDLNLVDEPKLVHRGIWYAYAGGDKELMDNYRRWAIANRLSVQSVIRTGHSYGNIIGRNKEAFDAHPEYFALTPDGKRDNERAINARKFCVSNSGLIELVVNDRVRLLEEYRRVNPAAYMISIDPSDGEGTCHCKDCVKIGTTTDRALSLANHVARGLREEYSDAWVGLYAYSGHRLPPTIKIEPNVYVQVAMGFNRTQYTLPELVERWSGKVGAIGLREYYGVEAWDRGLPGRMRGSRVGYHKKWIPFYADRKMNAINAETNANWGGQMLGLYVASQLMWDPTTDVDAVVDEFYQRCYGNAATVMRKLVAAFDESPPLRSATLVPMFADLQAAAKTNVEPDQRRRLIDMMAYLVYVAKFREFDLVRNRRPSRDDEYYNALRPLMQYAWKIRMRDIMHYYALARRLCNGLPVQDKRLDFYMFSKQKSPVWMTGEQLSDNDIVKLLNDYFKRLNNDGDPVVTFSRYFEPVQPPGKDVGSSRQFLQEKDGVATFRHRLTGYLIPKGKQTVRFGIAPTSRSATFTAYLRGDTILFEREFKKSDEFQSVEFELPKANEYRVQIVGGFKLHVPRETPFIFEASVQRPAWIDYSGPQYFYVPKGAKELIVDANPRLSLCVPGQKQRVDISSSSRVANKDYAIIPVPASAAGTIWHTSSQTRGQVLLMNVPPFFSFHRDTIFVPREIAEADELTTN
ncbi:MAG: hypothetical protein CMJ78_24820 [Planctomycetaceae bacterium]|nr:hypothetical protein [Planctomycetaceae bacterium]